MKKMVVVVISATAAWMICAANVTEPTMRLPAMRMAPMIDGEVKPGEWKDAHAFLGYCRYPTERIAPVEAQIYLGRTVDRLYVATVCEENPNGVFAVQKPRVGNVPCSYEDVFELVFVPDVTATKQTMRHIIVNYNGAYQAQAQVAGKMVSWIPADFRFKAAKIGDRWHMEMSFPLSDIGFTAANEKKHAIRLCRDWRWIDSSWGLVASVRPNESGFFAMGKAIPCAFDEGPAVQVLGEVRSGDATSWKAIVRVTNPTDKDLGIKLFAEGRPVNSQPGSMVQDFDLEAGATKDFHVSGPILGDETVDFKVALSDATGETQYYLREVIWSPNAPAVNWLKNGESGVKVSYKFAYYPSYNKMRLLADLSKVPVKDRPASVSATVRDAKKNVIWKSDLEIDKNGIGDEIVTIPDLKAVTKREGCGEYTIRFEATGVKDGILEKKFRRDIFEWEGNALGLSDAIPAPFTPIERYNDGWFGWGDDHVKTILRDHTIGENGLWKQVVAADREILARPMRLVGTAGAGVRTASEWDVDGMMRWDLTLDPGHYESLALEIPRCP
mgnify:CR=1 FL=1